MNTGLSEQFTFDVSITDYWSDTYLHDRMYTVDSSQDGLWNGVWGILRSKNTRDAGDSLVTLPSNPIPTVLLPGQGIGSDNVCPANARVRSYEVVAVLANRALDNSLGVTIPSERNTKNRKFSALVPFMILQPYFLCVREIWIRQTKLNQKSQ